MKQVVVDEQLDEMEVHPPGLYRELLDVCVASAEQLLEERDRFIHTDCPACGSSDSQPAFDKHGYSFRDCRVCATLFVSPRPSAEQLDWYLLHSPAAAFRDGLEYREAMIGRAVELVAYRAEWISELCDLVGAEGQRAVVDLETRWPRYLAELGRRHLGPIVTVKPLCSLSELLTPTEHALTTADDLTQLKDADARLITVFDVLEHQANPSELMTAAHGALGRDGLLIITTRSAGGLDIQTLWQNCTTVFPMEHINLVSLEGMRTLLTKTGFKVLEASTPGQLDVQIVERALQEQPDVEVPRFLRYFLTHRDRFAKRKLQQFLQENLLSSHLRVVARKVPVT